MTDSPCTHTAAHPVAAHPVAADELSITSLGPTSLKWSADGELTSLDLRLVMERLAQVDRQVTDLHHDNLDS